MGGAALVVAARAPSVSTAVRFLDATSRSITTPGPYRSWKSVNWWAKPSSTDASQYLRHRGRIRRTLGSLLAVRGWRCWSAMWSQAR